MKLLPGKKTKTAAAEEQETQELAPAKSKVNDLATRLLMYGFYGLVLLGFGLSVLAVILAASSAGEPEVKAEVVDTSPAESMAASYVSAWLRASRDDQSLLEPYIGGTRVPLLPVEPLAVRDVAVAGVQRGEDPSITSVTVAAYVEQPTGATKSPGAPAGDGESLSIIERATAAPTTPAPSPAAASGSPSTTPEAKATPTAYQLRYYQVAVREETPGRLQVIGYPTPVPGPAQGEAISLDYATRITPDTELGKMLEGFLQAYAAGQSDVSRFLAADYKLAAIEPAPYTRLHIQEIRTNEAVDPVQPGTPVRALIQAEAELPDERGSRMGVTVPVTVTYRDGRWEVTSLDPAPLIDPTAQSTPSTP